MKTHSPQPDPRHVTGYHEFPVFDDDSEPHRLLAVPAGIPITQVVTAAHRILDSVVEFERERLVFGGMMDTRASRWLLAIAEGLLASACESNIEKKQLR